MFNYPCQDIYLIKALTRSSVILLLVMAFQLTYAQNKSEPKPNKEYLEAISIADKHLLTGDYLQALNEYEKAWNLYQRQTYPETKIDQINKILANTPLSRTLYEKAIRQGDSCFSAKDYKTANTEYYNALRLDPSAQYPKKKLCEVSAAFVDPENETRYRIVLIHAGKAFDRAKYDKAISYYQQALLINPSEKWIEKKIDETVTLKMKYLAGMDPYTRCLAESDNLIEQKKWIEAHDGFAKALAMRPKEKYPAAKIVLLEHLPALNKSGKRTYSSYIEDADKFYKFQDYEDAAIHYQEALNLKPNESYPKNMLKKLGHINVDADVSSQNYTASVANADILSLAGDSEAALIGYKRCIAKQPGDNYVKSRITELTVLLNTTNESSTAYQQAVAKGDRSMASLNYTKAMAEFRYASKLKPDESYPKEKIEEIQNRMLLKKSKEAAEKEAHAETVETQSQKEDSEVRSKTKAGNNLIPIEEIHGQKDFTLSINNDEQKIKDKDLGKILVSADSDLDKKEHTKVTDSNHTALEIKPQENYPGQNTNANNKLIAGNKLMQETGMQSVATEDNSSNENQNAVKSKTYKSASGNKPYEKHPQEKVVVINPTIEQQKTVESVNNAPSSAPVKAKEDLATLITAPSIKAEHINIPVVQKTQEKIIVSKPVLTEQNANQEKYDNAIAFADKAFIEKNYPYAVNGYKAALKLKSAEKYPQERIDKINLIKDEENTSFENYKKNILIADKAYAEKDYTKAKTSYQAALSLNPAQKYPQDKIASINAILGQQKARQERYNTAISSADNAFDTKDYVTALTEFKTAIALSPAESYPKERIEAISALMIRQKVVQDNYNKAIMTAEKAFAAKDYPAAISGFQSALNFKPEEDYPQERITAINNILAQNREKRDKQYADYIGEADAYYSKQEFPVAQKEYKMASELKPEEEYPREKYKQIADILIAKAKETKVAYEGAIAEADKTYKLFAFDQAVVYYTKALEIKPGEIYPGQMIARIRKNMMDHSLVEITAENFILKNDAEKRFSFLPVNASMRKSNYLVVRARISGNSQPKLYINYGSESTKNGGVVIKNINSDMLNDFVVNISLQDKWFREDNNWLSLYSENGDLEVASIRISQGR